MVIHEHRFEVRLGTRADLIFGGRAERVARVWTHEDIVRSEVEPGAAGHELVAADLPPLVERQDAGDRVELELLERARRRSRRAGAVEVAVIRVDLEIGRGGRAQSTEGIIA